MYLQAASLQRHSIPAVVEELESPSLVGLLTPLCQGNLAVIAWYRIHKPLMISICTCFCMHAGGSCCPRGNICMNGRCMAPGSSACGATACSPFQTCLSGKCCDTNAPVCGSTCCDANQMCVNGQCVASGSSACGGTVCGPNQQCLAPGVCCNAGESQCGRY